MENNFFVDSEYLSEKALIKKHRIENDPSFRKNHMEYMEGMEVIESDICSDVMFHFNSYDYQKYTSFDVERALEHDKCTIEDFKALLSPVAEPYLEQMAERARAETSKHFGNTVYLFTPLYISNYCENYCVYCGFNCYNHIRRKKLSLEQIERGVNRYTVLPKCLLVSALERSAICSRYDSATGERRALKSSVYLSTARLRLGRAQSQSRT